MDAGRCTIREEDTQNDDMFFTATGNCLYVARKIGGTLLSIPQLMRQRKVQGVKVTPAKIAKMALLTKTHATGILKKDTALGYIIIL